MAQAKVRLTLYTRARCPLCDQAEAALRRARDEVGGTLDFNVVDIEGDERLTEAYGELIPVVTHGDEILFIGKVSVHRLKAMLESDGDRDPAPRVKPRYKMHLERLSGMLRRTRAATEAHPRGAGK